MKCLKCFVFSLIAFLLGACTNNGSNSEINKINWDSKAISTDKIEAIAAYKKNTTYLPVYPEVFNVQENKKQKLTVTVSIRNTSPTDSLYLFSAKYYNTKGDLIRVYFDFPLVLVPLETDHIVINHTDISGGTGANFLFEWKKKPDTSEPLFEAVMLSTYAQQGISFTTCGVKL